MSNAVDKAKQTKQAMHAAAKALHLASSCLDGYYIPRGKTTLPEIEKALELLDAALKQEPPVRLTGEEAQSFAYMLEAEREYEPHTAQEYLVVRGVEDFVRAVETAVLTKNGIKVPR